jgi:small subunit ribosomal protein S3
MGQKANPLGLRLPLSQEWVSRWFAADKRQYQKNLLEDVRVRRLLMAKLRLAGVTQVQIERSIGKMRVKIFVSRPGMVIGRGGSGLEMLKKELASKISLVSPEKNLSLEAVEVRNPDLSAYLVAVRVGEQLERRMPYRRVMAKMIERVMQAGAKGVKIQLAGRIGGAEISRREKFGDQGKAGTIPGQTLRAEIDYAAYPCLTRSGYIGIKVWIYKGLKI